MGRLTLLLVLAAAIGGTVLTLSTRSTLLEATSRQSEDQADVLAREIAEAGESVALARMMGTAGFIDPTTNGLSGPLDYNNGQFEVLVDDYSPAQVTFTVTGTYGGAAHTIQSTYEFDTMDTPGPLWLDVPYATADIADDAEISGATDDHPVYLDRRRHDELEVESLVSLSGLTSTLGADMAAAGSALATPAASDWEGETGLLEDLNVSDAEGLYRAAIDDPAKIDRTFTGDYTQAGMAAWGSAFSTDEITRVTGDLTVTGTVSGHGALVVEGAFRVPVGGSLTWSGLIIVRGETNVLPIELDGDVTITGSLVVSHEALPPGGHLDVSVYHDPTVAAPEGDRDAQQDSWSAVHPWHQHTHAFDRTPTSAPRGDHVYFLEGGGASRHESRTRFQTVLAGLGEEEVYLEIGNEEKHGYARYNLDIAGLPDPLTGSARMGFGAFASVDSDFRTKPFPAADLDAFDLDVGSLRALRQSFDDAAIPDWPRHIGWAYDRHGAMTVRLVRASDGARLYEASMYWHMRQDESTAHEAEEAAWRARILAGEEFGTKLRLGDDVDLTYEIGPIAALSDKLGFDGNEVVLLSTASEHITPAEMRAQSSMSETEVDDEETESTLLCHKPGRHNERTLRVNVLALAAHIAHGDLTGACADSGSGSASGRSGRGRSGRGRSGRGRSGRSGSGGS